MTYNLSPLLSGLVLLCFAFAMPSVDAQVVIGQPSFDFSRACASDSFNDFTTSFIFNPPSAVSASNQFIVELSDATGDFTQSIEVYESDPGEITTSPATVSFSIPVETAGDNYKIRIRGTAPSALSASSQAFPAYYKVHDTPFTINGLVDTGTYCPGTGYLLTIDDPGFDGAISPLSFDTLNFNWFKAIGSTNAVLVGQGETYLASEEGIYFVETDYGSCPSNSFSNRVTITQAMGDEPANASIFSSLGTTFCSEGEGTVLSTINGDTYQWFRDDAPINGATQSTLQTNESGNYAVIVMSGDCVAVGSISIESLGGLSTLNVPAINYLEDGESLEVIVNTNSDNATYEWYYNNELITSAQSDRFTATQIGAYSVIVSATGACELSTELFFEIKLRINIDTIPNVISPNGDGLNDNWMIPAEYLSGSGTEISIFSSTGEQMLKTTEYLNNWPDNVEDIATGNQVFYYFIMPQDQEAIKGTLTIIR